MWLHLAVWAVSPIVSAPPTSHETEVAAIERLWRQSSRDAAWRAPGIEERNRLRDGLRWLLLVAASTCDVDGNNLDPYFEGTPFEVTVLPGRRLWVVHERADARVGGGLYVVRCGAGATPWVLQAPHSFFDKGTRRIVLQLFSRSGARAAYFNTVHRYRSVPQETSTDDLHPADVAHQYGSFFQAATLAAAVTDPLLRFIQVHGFRARPELPWDVIVSSGLPNAPPRALASRLRVRFGRVAAFDGTVGGLGALTNVQGLALNRHGSGRFVHLELGESTRQEWRAPHADALLAALQEPWW